MASGTNARGTGLVRAEQLGRSNHVSSEQRLRRMSGTPARGVGRRRVALAAAAALAGATLLAPSSAYATSDTWDGQTSGAWATPTNWLTDPAVVPGTGDTATFNNAGNGNTLIDLGGGVTINSIVFDAGAASYTIGSASGQSLSLDSGGSIIMNAGVTADQTIGVAGTTLNLSSAAAASATLTNNSANLLTIGANIVANNASGNGVLNVDGSGNTLITGTVTEPGAAPTRCSSAAPARSRSPTAAPGAARAPCRRRSPGRSRFKRESCASTAARTRLRARRSSAASSHTAAQDRTPGSRSTPAPSP